MSRKQSNLGSSHDDTGVSKEGTSTDDAVANSTTLSATSHGYTGVVKGTSTGEACDNYDTAVDLPYISNVEAELERLERQLKIDGIEVPSRMKTIVETANSPEHAVETMETSDDVNAPKVLQSH